MAGRSGKNTIKTTLNTQEREKLKTILSRKIVLEGGKERFEVSVLEVLRTFFKVTKNRGIPVSRTSLVGGLATHICQSLYPYNDCDLTFPVNLENPDKKEEERVYTAINYAVIETLQILMVASKSTIPYFNLQVIEEFFSKKFKFNGAKAQGQACDDSWALYGLRASSGRDIELKFVLRMRRSCEFITDSLCIDMMPMIAETTEDMGISSFFGLSAEIWHIIKNMEVRTRDLGNISGGGLLKYCYLKSIGLQDAGKNGDRFVASMAAGFFTRWGSDARNIKEQAIEKYLQAHYKQDERDGVEKFLSELSRVARIAENMGYRQQCSTLTFVIEQINRDLNETQQRHQMG